MLPTADHSPRAGWTLALLTGALTLSYVDRYLLAVCLQPIKLELALSDTELGVLTGLAFSLFYALLTLPIARLSDGGFRREVIAWSIASWSLMTALTGLVHSFALLAVARFGVGAGEAGVFPSSQAMISSHFPSARRTTALAVFGVGGSLGMLIAFSLGSWLESRVGWRWTFAVMALPGIPLSLLALFGLPREMRQTQRPAPTLTAALALLWSERDFRDLPFAQSALAILLFAQAQWLPAFFERSFGVNRVVLGSMLGLTQTLATVCGMVLGGVIADRLRQRRPDGPLRLALSSILASSVPLGLLYSTANVHAAYVFCALATFLLGVPAGPIAAHLQMIFPAHLRASASAGALVITAVLGLGGGPLLIGSLSDVLSRRWGLQSLRYALLITVLLAIIWATHHLIRLLRRSPSAAQKGVLPSNMTS